MKMNINKSDAVSKNAFIAIIGCPNVGKSSILNYFCGQKIAIVTDKPQTTRTKITGVVTENGTQIVFTDTPGMHRPKNKLGEKMIKVVGDSITDVDACLLVVEPYGEVRDAEKELIAKLKKEKMPAILAINKIDTVKDKSDLMTRILTFTSLYDFDAVVPVCAKNGSGMDALFDEICRFSQEGPHFFDDDTLTDRTEREIVAEMIREKLLRLLDKEIPHGIAVSVEKMREREDGGIIDIEAIIYCEKESHKGIIIGKGGSMLKRASSNARADIEKFLDSKVNLQCWVKVKEDWRNREGIIHNFGLDSD